jgi:glycosyltransferase involved in cell wall biosynthesis
MRIAHVCDSMEMGGAEKVTAMLCRLQQEQGHSCSVECLYAVGVLGEQLRASGITVNVHGPGGFLGLTASLYREFRRCTPDIVHLHNPTAAIVGALPARLSGVKSVIATRHGLVRKGTVRREVKFSLASRLCDWVVGVSEETSNSLRHAPLAAQDRIVTVFNGTTAIGPDATPLPKQGPTLLHVGRLHPAKDQATLLRAFALAQRKVPDLKLWIVGDGVLRGALEILAGELRLGDSVVFFGEQHDVAPFFLTADLFVMSSVTEGLPIVLLEAMSVGLPSIVTHVGGMAEIARMGAAVAVPPSDEAALADAIGRNIADQDCRRSIGSSAATIYSQHFKPEIMFAEYMMLYGAGVKAGIRSEPVCPCKTQPKPLDQVCRSK